MTYDEDLADRIRDELCDIDLLTERRMFGGLAFLIGGHMAVVASGQGGLLARVDPEAADREVEAGTARLAVMRNREMRGWLRITANDVATSRALRKWTALSRAFIETLPPKN